MRTPETTPWIAVLRGSRLARLVPVPELPVRIGSAPDCGLRLQRPEVPPLVGRLQLRPDGAMEYVPEEGTDSLRIRPGEHLSIPPYTLAFLELEGADQGSSEILAALCHLIPALLGAASEEAFFQTLLRSLREFFACQWGAVLEIQEDPEPRLLWADGTRPGRDDSRISRSVLEQLRESPEPLLAANVESTPAFQAAASLHQEVHSVIACRLGVEGSLRGVLYLESRGRSQPFSARERDLLAMLCTLANQVLERSQDHRRLGALSRANQEGDGPPRRILGDSPATRGLLQQAEQAGEHQVTTLILGESGTGKELVARSVHQRGARRHAPFVAVHCMALSPELIESELFGHRKGAFSGANETRIGRFEMAHGGTLFLDELGELSPGVQVKLLRVLEERSIQRVGESREREVDVQLLAATNADLDSLIRQGRFREDLYYRLSVFRILVPPLRERLEDLPILVKSFLAEGNRRYRKAIQGISPEAQRCLRSHPWPGNIRELRNTLLQAVIREESEVLQPGSLGLGAAIRPEATPIREAAPLATATMEELVARLPEDFEVARAMWERAFLLRILKEEQGNVVATHRRLGISRPHLYRKLVQHGISPESLRS